MKQPPSPPSKLFIRSEVLAVIEFFAVVDNPPKQDKLKQIKRLSAFESKDFVLEILVKELQRSTKQRDIQSISELLMEIGSIDSLQEPLWKIIRNGNLNDEVKDAANLILHHLGDESDPDLYLDYLDDPQGLINRETERMLEVSATNPEALIDFIDFIFSLPIEEQCNLINSLQTDYQAEYLINIYIPSIWADPPELVKEQIIKNIGKTRSKRSALLLSELQEYYTPEIDPSGEIQKIIKKSINELKLAGIYRPELFDAYREELTHPHPIVDNSKMYQCYATLSDGIGNQGLMISRQKENGDIVMMSVAINDIHGIIDCFGFFQLSETDFNRIVEKFHEESTKILIHPAYCLHKLKKAESMNQGNRFRLPYEYTCWKVLLDDVIPESFEPILACKEWANEKWEPECGNLYQHPDFHTWFLERGDHPVMNAHLNKVQSILEGVLEKELPPSAAIEQFQSQLEILALSMVQSLYDSDWKGFFLDRLAEAAYLLNHQKTTTFSRLAATEVLKIKAIESEKNPLESPHLKTGFILQYGKRCLEEELLRLKQQPHQTKLGLGLMDSVLENWTLPD